MKRSKELRLEIDGARKDLEEAERCFFVAEERRARCRILLSQALDRMEEHAARADIFEDQEDGETE